MRLRQRASRPANVVKTRDQRDDQRRVHKAARCLGTERLQTRELFLATSGQPSIFTVIDRVEGTAARRRRVRKTDGIDHGFVIIGLYCEWVDADHPTGHSVA